MKRHWMYYAVPREDKPKLSAADVKRFLDRKREVDERNARLAAEAKEIRRVERGE